MEFFMQLTQKTKYHLGVGMYVSGMVIGLLLAIVLAWADFEASFFEFGRQSAMLFGRSAEQQLDKFSCPLAITRNEMTAVRAEIRNPHERQVKTVLRMSRTEGSVLMVERFERQLEFAPGESIQFEWPIQASDAAWGRFIMARAFVIPSSPMPSMASYCGILVIDLPFLTGNQVLALAAIFGLVLLGGGWHLWMSNAGQGRLDSEKNRRLLAAYALLIVLGVVLAIFTNWILAGALLLLNLLLTLGALPYKIMQR
jgi:hypothetical protein